MYMLSVGCGIDRHASCTTRQPTPIIRRLQLYNSSSSMPGTALAAAAVAECLLVGKCVAVVHSASHSYYLLVRREAAITSGGGTTVAPRETYVAGCQLLDATATQQSSCRSCTAEGTL